MVENTFYQDTQHICIEYYYGTKLRPL